MPIDPSIPLGAQAPAPINPLQTLAQVQAYQGNALRNQVLGSGLAANQAQSQAVIGATDPTTGQVDWNKALTNLSQNPQGAYNAPVFAKQVQDMQTGQIGLSKSQLELAKSQNGFLMQRLGSIDPGDPNFQAHVMQTAVDFVNSYKGDPQKVAAQIADMPPIGSTPQQNSVWLQRHLGAIGSVGEQLSTMQPTVLPVNRGGSTDIVAVNKMTGAPTVTGSLPNTASVAEQTARVPTFVNGQPGSVPAGSLMPPQLLPPGSGYGGGAGNQPPPLPTIPTPAGMPTASANGVPPLPAGPVPGGQPGAAPAGFVATGPAMGVSGSNDGNVATVNAHWSQLSNDATAANTNIGIAQNIKAYADKALSGPVSDKLSAVNGILTVLGVPGATDLQTATDLLNKNMARLSLSSRSSAGGTDAAGALATAANPHGTMTAAAIKDAADQVIGAQQMALAEQQLLQPYKLSNNVAGYQQAQTVFNQAADPRIWQFQNMDQQQRTAFKASMSPADQKSFGAKIRTLEGLGAIQ